MARKMTIEEINLRFESEWVLLSEPDTDEELNVKSGTLVYHSRNRDEVYRKAVELKPKRSALLFAGGPVDKSTFALCGDFAHNGWNVLLCKAK